jgi:Tol biopolymer transport system component
VKLFNAGAVLTLSVAACAEPPAPPAASPSTDIFVGQLSSVNGQLTVTDVRNATDRDGYDNQPHFTPDGAGLLYTSQRDGQTDIYRLDVSTMESQPVTSTEENEYSATMMPGGQSFSVIRGDEQFLWSFTMAGEPIGKVFEHIIPVGYHAWSGPNAVAMFILPVDSQGITLHLADPETQDDRIITNNIGRSFNLIPGRTGISFVDKSSESWTISELDPSTGGTTVLAETLNGAEDHAWTPDGAIVMGSESTLHAWTSEGGWQTVADLNESGVTEISRLAINSTGTTIAIVATRH